MATQTLNYKFINGKRIKSLDKRICPVCNKLFQPKVDKAKYCSRLCYYEMKRIRNDRVKWTDEMREGLSNKYKGTGNPMFGKESWNRGKKIPEMSGDKHPNWKGGYWISDTGYKIIQNEKETKQRKIAEHRIVMEAHLGRKLTKNEVVHHINGDKLDNRIENLEVMDRAKHLLIHHYPNNL